MSNWLEEPRFNIKRVKYVLYIFAIALAGLFFYSEIINAISVQTCSFLIAGDALASALVQLILRREEEEQEEEQEILREIKEKHRMQKEIETLKAELEKKVN